MTVWKGTALPQQCNIPPNANFLIGVHRSGLALDRDDISVLIAEIERLRALLNPAPTLYHWLGRDAE